MTMLPLKTAISDTYPNPSNATARAGFATLWDALNEFQQKSELDLASAATLDIGGQATTKLRITGTTGITSFGTNYRGPILIRWAGAVSITNNATTLRCPGGASYTTTANEVGLTWPIASVSGTPDGWQYASLSGGAAAITSGSITGITDLAIADGGTGASTASAARTNLGLAYGPSFSAYASVDQSISSGVNTKVTLGTEEWDTANCFASSRFTPNVAGYYMITGAIKANSATMTENLATIFKNGSLYHTGQADVFASTNASITAGVTAIVLMNGSTDYVELYGQVTGGTPKFAYTAIGNTSRFSGCLLRPS